MKISKGNFGEVRFCDNMDDKFGIPSLEEKQYEALLTDPPYNIKSYTVGGKGKGLQDYKIRYKDNMKPEEYKNWCINWYNECRKKSKFQIFTPGYKNFKFWMRENKYDFEVMVIYDITSQGGCRVASFRKWEPILTENIHNYRKRHKRFKFAIFDEPNHVNQTNFCDFKHPCPKNIKLWTRIIKEIKPISVLDPFMGSGTTAETCESLGIQYLGYEIMEEYKPDIDKRIKRGIKRHSQKNLDSFF